MSNQKELILQQLKSQWKVVVQQQYESEPDKVINANVEKNAKEIMSNPVIKMTSKMTKITLSDIVKMLNEIKQEVIKENES